MDSEPIIVARRLSKIYHIYRRPIDRLRQILFPNGSKLYQEFPAVQDVDLEVFPGEVVGIVGRNGSGKSTLLKMICKTLAPTSGELTVRGRAAPLLTIGAGFNPDFTGRENILLNASILRLSEAEIRSRLPKIEAFADIGRFFDRPVRSYSSGMYSRLAFAVAIHTDPQILVVDEILAVGDEAFSRKCFSQIEQLRAGGCTILFVSHAADTIIQLCDRAILMENGRNLLSGTAKTVVYQYQRLVHAADSERQAILQDIKLLQQASPQRKINADSSAKNCSELFGCQQSSLTEPIVTPEADPTEASFNPSLKTQSEIVYDSQGAWISEVIIVNDRDRPVNCLKKHQAYTLTYRVQFERAALGIHLSVGLRTVSGGMLGGYMFPPHNQAGLQVNSGASYQARFKFECLLQPGYYFVNINVTNKEGKFLHRRVDALMFSVMPEAADGSYGLIDFKFSVNLVDEYA